MHHTVTSPGGIAILATGAAYAALGVRLMWWPTIREAIAARRAESVDVGPEVAARAVPTRWTTRATVAVVVAVAVFLAMLAATTATASAAGGPSVAYAAPAGGRLYVELSTGRVYPHLRPCPAEDSRHCFWDATTRGDGHGTPVVKVHGMTLPYTVAAS
jgi:hypothetical protein